MPRLPHGVTWLHMGILAAALGSGLFAAKESAERLRLIGLLEHYGEAHPEDRELVQVLVGCHKTIRVDVAGCGAKVLERFGPDVVASLGKMQSEGAFGSPAQR